MQDLSELSHGKRFGGGGIGPGTQQRDVGYALSLDAKRS
jgi:hypothetical protein